MTMTARILGTDLFRDGQRFEAHFNRKAYAQLQRVRTAIEATFARATAARRRLVRLALNEAEALASQTAYPHLVFPTLAQEKVRALSRWERKQAALLSREPELAFAE